MVEVSTDDLVLKGILDGKYAFSGPEIVQFDVTNMCNNNCLCCWNNSPLLGEPTSEKAIEKNNQLPFDLIEKTIGELAKMGTKNLFFAGGGEPFIHPHIIEILECAKDNDMRVCINTNFTLLDEKKIKKIVELKIDHIHVSLLAGNSKNYVLVHPNKTEKTFFRIKTLLEYLARLKEEKRQSIKPHLNMYYVIFNVNYCDIKEMVDLALQVKANSLEFTPADVIPGKTDILLLNSMQRLKVFNDVKKQYERLKNIRKLTPEVSIFIEQYDSFINRISGQEAEHGEYETSIINVRPCYTGWVFARILADGNVNPCLKAHKIPIGNIYRQPFRDIWNSQEQQLFRNKSFRLDRNDTYFRKIGNNPDSQFGCLNSCDNVQINIDMHNRYQAILRKYGRIK
jgi:MoaA/NifB/PqqE/SkfB family radical SAM enzyme